MSTRTPTLSDRWLRRVRSATISDNRRVWICKLACDHTANCNYRKNRRWPRELRCAECAGVKGGAS